MNTIDEAINYAAENLPSNYTINILIEKDGYGVELVTPYKGVRSQVIGMSEESIIDDIVVATDNAKDNHRESTE